MARRHRHAAHLRRARKPLVCARLRDRFPPRLSVCAGAFGSRVALTRFLAPTRPEQAWVSYYEAWRFALDPVNAVLYDLVGDFPVDDAVLIDPDDLRQMGWRDRQGARAARGRSSWQVSRRIAACCRPRSQRSMPASTSASSKTPAPQPARSATAAQSTSWASYAPLIDITSVDAVLASLAPMS